MPSWSKRTLIALLAALLLIAAGVGLTVRHVTSTRVPVAAERTVGYRDGRVLIEDHFDRTVANGWKDAEAGGSYALAPRDGFSVGHGVGVMDLPEPGVARTATINSTRPVDVRASVRMILPQLPTRGTGVYLAMYLRSGGQSSYRADLRFTPSHQVFLSLSRFDGSPTASQLLAPGKLVATQVKPGEPLILTFRVVGVTPVTLAASVRKAGSLDPGWQQVVEDASASRLVAGGAISLWSYVGKSSDHRRRVLYDDLIITQLVPDDSGQAAPEPRKAPGGPVPGGSVRPTSSLQEGRSSNAGSKPVGGASYGVPAAAVFVSPHGPALGLGTALSPFRSVQQALDRARPGGVVVLRAGKYHESVVLPPGKRLTVQSYPRERVWFDGRSRIPRWQRDGKVWVAKWKHNFDASPTFTKSAPDNDEAGWRFVSTTHPMAAHPEQLWLGGKRLRQVGSRSAVRSSTFFVDQQRRKLVLGSKPTGRSVRASTLQHAIRISGKDDRIRGIGVRGYAPSVWQGGAVLVEADDVKLENVAIVDNATIGLSVAAGGTILNGITVKGNGMLGINGHHADDLRATGVLAVHNNVEHFNFAPSAGGMKITASRRITITESDFSRNIGQGLWLDASCYDLTLVSLGAHFNAGGGVRVELSSRALIVGSVITGNGSDGLRIANTDRLEIANNTLARNVGRNLAITTDTRRASSTSTPGHDSRFPGDGAMPWLSDHINVYNNVFSDGGGSCIVCVLDNRRIPVGETTVKFDHNYYQRTSVAAPSTFATWPSANPEPLKFADLASIRSVLHQDGHSFLSPSAKSAVHSSGKVTRSAQATASRVARGLTPAAAAASGRRVGAKHLGAWT